MEGELLTFPEYLCSPRFQWVIVAQSLDFYVVFVLFSFCHCVVCHSSICLFRLPLSTQFSSFFHANSILYQKQISKNTKPEIRFNTMFTNYFITSVYCNELFGRRLDGEYSKLLKSRIGKSGCATILHLNKTYAHNS